MSYNVLEGSRSVKECSRKFRNVPECFKMFKNLFYNAGGTQKINLLHKAGGRVVYFGYKHQRKVEKFFFLNSTKS